MKPLITKNYEHKQGGVMQFIYTTRSADSKNINILLERELVGHIEVWSGSTWSMGRIFFGNSKIMELIYEKRFDSPSNRAKRTRVATEECVDVAAKLIKKKVFSFISEHVSEFQIVSDDW
jgi:hypothetical protein